ncbi:MAG: hypothetical protein J6T45_01985, partial [Fibrobacterales bacterium]|nr:hypothetical protein [Fibrobacterales bacterium]
HVLHGRDARKQVERLEDEPDAPVAHLRELVGVHLPDLLADEATGNLDSRTSLEILALFQKLESEGKTIVFVTHSPDVALYSARTLHLLDGRLRDDETVAERKFV